jgi:threonine aldolase
MRQAGYLAAAGIFALDYHVDRLVHDHQRATELSVALKQNNHVKEIFPVETNIVLFELHETLCANDFLSLLREDGIHAVSMGSHLVRFVTHLQFDDQMLEKTCKAIRKM